MRGTIKIEPYQPLGVRTPGVPGGGYINVDASAGRFGPSLGWPFGVGIAEGLGGMAPALAEQLGRDNEATVKGADTRLGEAERTLLSDPRHGYLNTQGQDALTHSAAVLEAYEMAQDREAEALGDDDQRRMFDELAPRRLEGFAAQVERHSAAERQRWHDEASDRRIALAREDAGLHWNDDALLRRALGTARVELRDKGKRHGWDAPRLQAGLRQETSRALVGAIEAAVERDAARAGVLRERYGRHIDAGDLAALDALLDEALTRRASEEASEAIVNGRAPAPGADGNAPVPPLDTRTGRPTLTWQLEQAVSIAEPAVRAATIRRLRSADAEVEAAAEARARALGEHVLARVMQDGLTDPSQIPVREWVALDAERRQAIESLLDHNLRGDEPAPNPTLVDELATQMTEAPRAFARLDLVPLVARLPLAQWQRFRDWQAGLRRDDPATGETLYAIKRGLRIAEKVLPAAPDDVATNYRADLVEEIDTWRRVTGKSPDDAYIAGMLRRVAPATYAPRTLEADPCHRPEVHQVRSSDTTFWGMTPAMWRALFAIATVPQRAALNDALGSLSKTGGFEGIDEIAKTLDLVRASRIPSRINSRNQTVYYNPATNRYIVRNTSGNGFWVEFDADGNVIGTTDISLTQPVPRTAQPTNLEETWQTPPLVPPVMPPPALPGRPTDQQQGPIVETFPHEETAVQTTAGPQTIAPPGPSIETFPLPDIELPTIYEYEKWQHHPDGREFTNEEYDEFQKGKLPYVKNPAHHDGDVVVKKYRRADEVPKTPIPPDAEKVYEENSVKADKYTWIGRNEHGVYYKYQDDNAGKVHFQGYLTKPQVQQYFGRAAKPTLEKLGR